MILATICACSAFAAGNMLLARTDAAGCTATYACCAVHLPAGAIRAPMYIHGVSSAAEWRFTAREQPAPWGEVGSSKLVISTTREALQGVDDPVALMDYWDKVGWWSVVCGLWSVGWGLGAGGIKCSAV